MNSPKLVNKKARFEYEVMDEIEAGMVLLGMEVKSLRLGRGSINEAFVRIIKDEAFLVNATIPGYQFADTREYDPKRSRKLLLKRKEIEFLKSKLDGANLTLIPIKIRERRNKYRLVVGLARGKKQYEKREGIKRRDLQREVEREIKNKIRIN
jgi:SsrA-binding protein